MSAARTATLAEGATAATSAARKRVLVFSMKASLETRVWKSRRGSALAAEATYLRHESLLRHAYDGYAYKKETGNGLNYQSIGSGGGIKQIQAKTVTFGASDMPLKQDDLNKGGLIQFPTVLGGVVPVVNIEGIKPGDVTLDGPTLARIF